MADIELRFGKDMLVVSAPVDATLARQGIEAALDRQYLNLMEPDVMKEALRLELLAGAHCLVTTTEDITRARLAHVRMESDASKLAHAALALAAELKPQHLLVEIGPCGLPLDASSKASLNENRAQYADAARAFSDGDFDAFFLNGFTSIADMKCALMGVAQVSGKPVISSFTVGEAPEGAGVSQTVSRDGRMSDEKLMETLPFSGYEIPDDPIAPPDPSKAAPLDPALWPDALDVMADLGAAVVGFETADVLSKAESYARIAAERTALPAIAQLRVGQAADDARARALVPIESRRDYAPDTMEHAAVRLYAAGVQFLRATGAATPAHTGALAATVAGLDVRARA